MSKAVWWGTVVFCGVLAACAPVQERDEKAAVDAANSLVYPAPPDEPRFAFERMILSSADATGIQEEDRLRGLLTGIATTSEGLSKPYAVAVHQGKIYVSDTGDRSVKVFDMSARKYFKIDDAGGSALGKPLGLDVDDAGNLYVADGTLKTILVFDGNGKFLRKIGGEKFFDRLSSVTVTPAGDRVYAVDIGGVKSEHHRVRVFDAVTGAHLMDIGSRGKGPGEFNLPRDLAIGRDGRLYVADGGNFRVQIFDREGKYISSFGKVGKQVGDFARPKEIATDKVGNVYVADAAFGNFQIFSPDGDLLMFIGERSERNGPAKYMLPSGIFADEDGRIYLVDQWFRKVDVFRPYGLPVGGGYFAKGAREKTGAGVQPTVK